MTKRKSIEITVAPDVWAYLKQTEINASGLCESAIRDKVNDAVIRDVARKNGVDYAHDPLYQCDTKGCKRQWTVETDSHGRMCAECEAKMEELTFEEASDL